ncbi:hypothetical protein BOTCAL_0531g00010 [Botryotinia calthae]|uniref:Uncharacterized protein n=1 Tax=Botryotinia calthae TaxID=38488 RepID=A0A4Y8CKL4_9HELO|nr:hypothetical protein BOTCAL_0531g00010 [Botryotinia calthae]
MSKPTSHQPHVEELPNPSLITNSQCFVAHLIFKPVYPNIFDTIIIIIVVVMITFTISTIMFAGSKIKEPESEPDMQQNKCRVKSTIFRHQRSSLRRISKYQHSMSTADL